MTTKRPEPTFLVDVDSPYSDLMFAGLGRVEFFGNSDPAARPDILAAADVLEVRSSTRVDAALLARCGNLKAVVTPVVGTDHIDIAAVAEAGRRLGREIPVFNAAGSTAEGVADWTIGAICAVCDRLPASVGIVGVGNVGFAVARRLDMMGVRYLTCDPGRAGEPGFVHTPLDRMADCEVVTFHVPLTRPGQSPWPTENMISTEFCSLADTCGCRLIVNCSRGGIMQQDVFAMPEDERPALACDVFRGEPCPDADAVAACAVATPHIAGSGRYGRARAAEMVREKVCQVLGLPESPFDMAACRLPERPVLHVDPATLHTQAGFSAFAIEISILSGVYLSPSFRGSWAVTDPATRQPLFTRTRLSGTRTEPVWVVKA